MKIYHLDTLVSTQDTAKEFLADGKTLPFAVIADMQTGGRGRGGNQWVSGKGNLFTSIVIPLQNIPVQHVGQYSFLTAVALMDCLADYGVADAVNKWPNDILVERKKIAGILLESNIAPDALLNALIIGVGVNLVSAPEGAISLHHYDELLSDEAGSFLSKLINHLEENLDILKQSGFAPIREKWLSKAHGLGNFIKVRLPRETFHGEFVGLDEEGALLVNVDGHPRKVYSGDVFFE